MDDIWMRILDNMSDRVSGPLKFRLLLQPLMAAIFAIKAGLLDARTGKPPYFWALATSPEHRVDMLKDGWKSVGKVFAALRVSGRSHPRRLHAGDPALPASARAGHPHCQEALIASQ